MNTRFNLPFLLHNRMAPLLERCRYARHQWPLGAFVLCAVLMGFPSGLHALFQTAALSHEAPPLDSFSAPSVALSVLNREALRLVMNYTQERDANGAGGSSTAPTSPTRSPLRRASGSDTAIDPIAKLHAQVQDFKLELDCRLLWIYADTHRPEQFLDRYLGLLSEAPPKNTDVILWLAQALQDAQSSGRSGELVDALRHWARFRGTAEHVTTVGKLLESKRLISSTPQWLNALP